MVTEPVEKELKRRGYKTEVIDPSKNETPHKDSKLIVCNYFWALGKLKNIYNLNKLPVAYITHGLSAWKYLGSGYKHCNYVFLTAEFERNKVFLINEKNPDNSNVILTGWPKLDSLYQKNKNKQKIKEKVIKQLGLNKNKPIIAYLPTHTHRSNKRISGSILFIENANVSKLDNFIIAIHYFDETKNDVKETLAKYKHVWSASDKYDLMVAADIIVGDISSIMVEALPLDKPIVHFLDNRKQLGLYESEEYGECALGEVCTDPKELVNIIKRNLEKDTYKTLREEWKEKLIHNFGTSTNAMADEIINILDKE